MIPLRDRIVMALALQPMTVAQLAKCLSCSQSAVRHCLDEVSAERQATLRTKRMGRPSICYGLAA